MKIKFVYILFFSFLLSSCFITKNNNVFENKIIFTDSEKQLILGGTHDKPMRVLLINNYEDSIILRTQSKSFIVDTSDKTLNHFVDRLYATVRDSASIGS